MSRSATRLGIVFAFALGCSGEVEPTLPAAPIEEAPLSRIRQRAGHNLSASWLNVPHVTQHDEADITELEAYRKSKGAAAHAQGVRLSPLVFVMKTVVLAPPPKTAPISAPFPRWRSTTMIRIKHTMT